MPGAAPTTPFGELVRATDEDPDALVVTFTDDRSYTRRELKDAAQRFAAGLARCDIQPRDRVAIFVGNRFEFLVTWMGINAAGCVAVPINTAMRGDLLAHLLRVSAPRLLVADADFADQILPTRPDQIGVEHLVWLGAVETPATSSATSFEQFVGEAAPIATVAAELSNLASILFTSGTTGPSKGVMWSNQTAISMAESALYVMDFQPSDVVFTCLPLFHSNALATTFFAALMRRARVVVAPRFSASQFWRQVGDTQATTVSLLGSMIPILCKQAPQSDALAHRLRLALVVPLSEPDYHLFLDTFGVECTSLYGLTDMGTPIGVAAGTQRPGSCGVVVPGWECVLADADDRPVADGEPGELLLRPSRPFMGQLGYWGMPEASVSAWRNLWFHTGDQMRQDKDGWFYFVDRTKDAIRRFGENISSFEVEQVLLRHPAVGEAAVFAVPSELAEDEVMASVVMKDGVELAPAVLIDWCEGQLPYFAVPRYLDFCESLPKTQTQKVQKQVLRATGVRENTYDRGPGGLKRSTSHSAGGGQRC